MSGNKEWWHQQMQQMLIERAKQSMFERTIVPPRMSAEQQAFQQLTSQGFPPSALPGPAGLPPANAPAFPPSYPAPAFNSMREWMQWAGEQRRKDFAQGVGKKRR